MSKITIIQYFDDDTVQTVLLAAKAYGIVVHAIYPTDSEHEAYVTIGGSNTDIEMFLEDLEDGSLEPFEALRDLSDNEYQSWLANELAKFGIKYEAKYINDEEDVA